jgi:hypothetical protein
MDWIVVSQRIKDHPVLLILSLLSAVVSLVAPLFDIMPPFWALGIAVVFFGMIVWILICPNEQHAISESTRVVETAQYPAALAEYPKKFDETRIRAWIQRNLIACKGDRARIDYFYNLVKNENQADSLYREVIESLKDDSVYGETAIAVDEWVSIGFETLVTWQGGWKSSGTLNRLYNAAHRIMGMGQFPMQRSSEFSQYVSSITATRRRQGL